jgi:hypothetical protein
MVRKSVGFGDVVGLTEWARSLPRWTSLSKLTTRSWLPRIDREQEARMFHHAGRHDIELVLRADRAAMLVLLWGALVGCVVGSLVFDVGHWLGAW